MQPKSNKSQTQRSLVPCHIRARFDSFRAARRKLGKKAARCDLERLKHSTAKTQCRHTQLKKRRSDDE
jgi:hypothetical protein